MVFSNPINIATATMEHIYERLCWIYSALRSTVVYDAIVNSYPLSDITQLTRGKIPYPARFSEMMDYKQNALIQDLQMKDILCTRKDWISRGRLTTLCQNIMTMKVRNYLSVWKGYHFGNQKLLPSR